MLRTRWLPVAAATLILAFTAAVGASAQCLLANPSFEMVGSGSIAFAGWNQFGPVGRSTTAKHGKYSARVTGPNTGNWEVSGFWQSQDCIPGRQWSASVLVFHSSTSPLRGLSRAILNIEWRDGGGNLISYESHTAADSSTSRNSWQSFSVTSQPAPAGTARIHFLLGVLQGPTDPTPQVLFDAATCVSLGPPTLETLQWVDFPSGRTVDFSGRTWRVKGPGFYGPGPNLFDNSANAVWIDSNNWLHLTIRRNGNPWYSSEVALTEPLGYGDYVFTTRGSLQLLDPNAVLGLFLWEYGSCYAEEYLWWNPHNEIDVEFSRWGSPTNPIAQFVAQPASHPGNILRFNTAFADTEMSSHAMRWLPDRVEYRSWRGGPNAEIPGNMIASWTYNGPHVPRPESPRVHINLWQLAAPLTNQEVVLAGFTFRPCPDGLCQPPVAVDSPPVVPARIAAAPNPFFSETTIRYSVAASGDVDLAILDISGRHVRRLVQGAFGAGENTVRWNGRDDTGQRVPPGVYFYRLRARGINETKRLVVLD